MHCTILVYQVCWYMYLYISQVSGERLQDHWSSGSSGSQDGTSGPKVPMPTITTPMPGSPSTSHLNTEATSFKCPTITTKTSDSSTTSQHTADSRPFKCPDCSKTFKVRRHLQVHYRIHSGVRPYECTECGLTFNQQGPLQV